MKIFHDGNEHTVVTLVSPRNEIWIKGNKGPAMDRYKHGMEL